MPSKKSGFERPLLLTHHAASKRSCRAREKFQEGVIVCKKDAKEKEGKAPKHNELDVPNLHVMMLMKSLTSKDFVK